MPDPILREGINNEVGRERSKRRWRVARRVFLLIALMVGAIFLVGVWEESSLRFGQWQVQNFANDLKKAQDDDYRRAMADTYGGKTPQETLRMYIDAVEKGDYEMASRYFVLSKQETELESLQSSPRKNVENIVKLLKESVQSPGGYSFDKR